MSHVRSVYDLFQGVRMTFSKNKFTTLLQTHVQNKQKKENKVFRRFSRVFIVEFEQKFDHNEHKGTQSEKFLSY